TICGSNRAAEDNRSEARVQSGLRSVVDDQVASEPIDVGLDVKVIAVGSVVVSFEDQVVSKVFLDGEHPDVGAGLIKIRLHTGSQHQQPHNTTPHIRKKGESGRNRPL